MTTPSAFPARSVLSLIFAPFIGHISDLKIRWKTYMWMMLGTFIQTIPTLSAAIVIWKSDSGSVADSHGNPAWTDVLPFVVLEIISDGMGLRGITGKRLGSS